MNKDLLTSILEEILNARLNSKATFSIVNRVSSRTDFSRDEIVSGIMTMIELKLFISVSSGKITDFEQAGIWFDGSPDTNEYELHKYNLIRLRGMFVDLYDYAVTTHESNAIKIVNDYVNDNCKVLYMST